MSINRLCNSTGESTILQERSSGVDECLAENCPVGYAQRQLEVVPLVHLQQQGRNTMNVAKSMYVHTTPFVTEAAILPLRWRRLLVPTAQAMEIEVQQDQDLAPCVSLSVHQRKRHSRSPAQDLVTQTEWLGSACHDPLPSRPDLCYTIPKQTFGVIVIPQAMTDGRTSFVHASSLVVTSTASKQNTESMPFLQFCIRECTILI